MLAVTIGIARAGLNLAYRARRRDVRRNEAVFLSRQSNTPSYDYEQLARAIEARGWQVTMLLKKVSARNLPAYVLHVWKEIGLLGRCRVAVIDRYDPVISLIDFECEPPDAANDSQMAYTGREAKSARGERSELQSHEYHSSAARDGSIATCSDHKSESTQDELHRSQLREGLSPTAQSGNAQVTRHPATSAVNTEFPAKPVILQLWHAFGAYKNFGFQSNDTPEGHPSSFMKHWRIHRNNTWVVCSGEQCRAAYAEAFACPVERVVVFDRPERDEIAALAAARRERESAREWKPAEARILMAPTLRYESQSQHPFRDLFERREEFEARVGARFTWSFHPLESGLPAPGNVSDALLGADFVVTDYSSIAYEAYLLGVPVVFYMPDLDDYRVSPGLNADPAVLAPAICTFSEDELAAMLARLTADPACYPAEALDAFAASAFDDPSPDAAGTTAADRLADFIMHA